MVYTSTFTNIYGDKINPPNPKKESLQQFIQRCMPGKKINMEGHINIIDEHMYDDTFRPLVKKSNKIVEIGFNAGHSALKFLAMNPNATMISFDLMQHKYSFFGKLYVDAAYPNRHMLIAGSSHSTVIQFHKQFPKYKADLIFIDGDHSFKGALNDIQNMKKLATNNTMIVIDDIVPHKSYGKYVYLAMKKAVEKKIITFIEHVKFADYNDAAVAICKFNFTNIEVPISKKNIDEIESKMRKIKLTKINSLKNN